MPGGARPRNRSSWQSPSGGRSARPDTTINSGPTGTIATDQATFTFAGNPAGNASKVQCKLDAGAYADCTSRKTFTGLSEGPHTAAFRAEGAVDNQDPSPATGTFTVDTTAPKVTITSPSQGSILTTTSASAAFAADEAGSSFECRLDAGAFAACSSPKAGSGLAAGSHTIQVRATDQASNTGAAASTSFTVKLGPSAACTAAEADLSAANLQLANAKKQQKKAKKGLKKANKALRKAKKSGKAAKVKKAKKKVKKANAAFKKANQSASDATTAAADACA